MSRETRSKLGAGIEGFDVLLVLFLLKFGPHPRPTLAELAMPHNLWKKYILRFLILLCLSLSHPVIGLFWIVLRARLPAWLCSSAVKSAVDQLRLCGRR